MPSKEWKARQLWVSSKNPYYKLGAHQLETRKEEKDLGNIS